MELFDVLAVALVTAALFCWLNHRWLRLPTTIGVMLIALAMSLGLSAMDLAGLAVREPVERILERLDFSHALLDVMLAFLLFAGALHVKVEDLYGQRRVIGVLATAGVLVTTALVGGGIWLACGLVGIETGLLPCLVFGAIVSPTDPIAVLGILKSVGAPRSLATKIAGESLFNDGIGVVVFGVLAALAGAGAAHRHGPAQMDAASLAVLFLQEVGGALVLGLAGGWVAYRLMRSVDDVHVEVLLTLALCAGVYAGASALHSSGPLAVVVAGLLVGNPGRRHAMSPRVVESLDVFWELVDEILNVLLFLWIGMEVLVIELSGALLALGALAVPLVLAARLSSVGAAVRLLGRWRAFTPGAVPILTWGGLRGGISVALAMSLPAAHPDRDWILTATYVVVVFSIAVQGLTVGRLIASLAPPAARELPRAHRRRTARRAARRREEGSP